MKKSEIIETIDQLETLAVLTPSGTAPNTYKVKSTLILKSEEM